MGDDAQEVSSNCEICGSDRGQIYHVREMMFGFGDVFEYFGCSGCGCLQLVNPPTDMGRYYPADSYYSFHQTPVPTGREADEPPSWRRPIRSARRWLSRRQREAVIFESRGIFERLARRHHMEGWANQFKAYVAESPRRSFRTRILDVGCGIGVLLSQLARYGFDRLEGVDPYLRETIEKPGYRVRNVDVRSLKGETYDLILMNHSLEHIPDQLGTLTAIRGLLARRGVCRIEIPVAGCEAWSIYGTDWVEIDAPRHYFLHTRKSIEILSGAAGLEIYRDEYVGTPFEFWGSELYGRGLTYFDAQEKQYRDPRSVFTEADIAEFERRSAEANQGNRGGRILFQLRRARRSPAGCRSKPRGEEYPELKS